MEYDLKMAGKSSIWWKEKQDNYEKWLLSKIKKMETLILWALKK